MTQNRRPYQLQNTRGAGCEDHITVRCHYDNVTFTDSRNGNLILRVSVHSESFYLYTPGLDPATEVIDLSPPSFWEGRSPVLKMSAAEYQQCLDDSTPD